MRASVGLVISCVVLGCGGSPAPKPAVPVAATDPIAKPGPRAAPPRAAPTAEAVCTRVEALEREHCGNFGKTIHFAPGECLDMFGRQPADPRAGAQRDQIARCTVEPPDCDGVNACLGALAEPDLSNLRACEDVSAGGAVGVTEDEYAQRNGSTAKTFGQVKSSPEAPIERCNIRNANEWLAALACSGGSHPIRSFEDAEKSRLGNIGAAGRCGSIVDHYRVACPEGATDIYIDAYVCPR